MKQNRNIFIPILTLLVSCLLACTDVELVDNSARATSSLVRITFNWNGEEADKPEYMHLIAVRNVMTWRAHGYVATEDGDNPWFGYSDPIIEEAPAPEPEPEPENPENPESPEEPEQGGEGNEGSEGGSTEGNEGSGNENTGGEGTGGDNNQPPGRAEGEEGTGNEGTELGSGEEETDPGTGEGEDETEPEPEPEEPAVKYPFRLRGGEYNVLAVNANLNSETVELKCLKDGEEVSVEGETATEKSSLLSYLTDHNRKANELYLCLKSNVDRPIIVKDKDLPDFNPQFEYVTDVPRIFYTLQTGFNVVPGTDAHLHLDMLPISQEVRVEFTIELNGNIEIQEQPVVELSGICGRFNLMEAYVDTTTLYRSVVEAEPVSQSGNLHVYQARFHTLGVVPSFSPTYLNGPGVLQVAVKAASTSPTNQNVDGRYIYAGINPHTELNESQIIVEGTDGKLRLRFSREPVVVKVEKHLVINENFLIDPGNGLGWEQQDPTDVDIDI